MLHHFAKEILALAVLELFPSVHLLEGGVDELSFFYDFSFPEKMIPLFGEQELEHLEDQMLKIIREKRAVKTLDMMRENAFEFLEHLGMPTLAQKSLEHSHNIVSLIQIGEFLDICPSVEFSSTEELKAFKLLKFEKRAHSLRIFGVAFEQKQSLKEFLKKYKKALKTDPNTLGVQQEYLIHSPDQEWIYLPKAEALLWELTHIWRQLHVRGHYQIIAFPSLLTSEQAHQAASQKKQFKKIASFDPKQGDFATVYCDKGKISETLASSLQFFQEALKIFPFKMYVDLEEKTPGLLTAAFEHLGIPFDKETRNKEKDRVVWSSFDGFGRKVPLSSIEIGEKQERVQHTLFITVKNWLAFCIEQGVMKFEFESQ